MISQNILQKKTNNPTPIVLSESKILDFDKCKPIYETKYLDFEMLYESIASVKNIKAAIEIISYSFKNLPKTKDYLTFKQNLIIALFVNYKYEEYENNSLLANHKIKKLSDTEFVYEIDKNPYCSKLIPRKTNNSLDYNENTFLKIEATKNAIYAAIKNHHEETAKELIRELLKNADLYLSVFSASNYPKYADASKIIDSVICLLTPEAQIYSFRILIKHFQQNLSGLLKFSNALLSKEYFDEAIILLESGLSNIHSQLTKEDIGNYYYNIGLTCSRKGNYQEAKKYYLNASNYLSSNDQDLILELHSIYLITHELQNAKKSLSNLHLKDIKNLLEMSLELNTVSTKKLKLINKKEIPQKFHPILQGIEYVAKFNENKFSNSDKISAFEKLCNAYINSNISVLFSIALYTKQYDFTKKILNALTPKIVPQNKYFYAFKILFKEAWGDEFLQNVIDVNYLQGKKAANIINISSTASIADGKFTNVHEKIEKALQYDSTNEETLEIGTAAALLNHDKDKAKEYLNQLSEEKQQEIAANYSIDNNA